MNRDLDVLRALEQIEHELTLVEHELGRAPRAVRWDEMQRAVAARDIARAALASLGERRGVQEPSPEAVAAYWRAWSMTPLAADELDSQESHLAGLRAAYAVDALRSPSERFSDVNLARCTAADGFGHALESWSIAEWTNAMAGEAGEACNLAKKLLRHRDGVAGNKKPEDRDVESLRLRCAEELADVVIYADLAMRALGHDLNDTVRRVFNRKSDELGAPYKVAEGPLASPIPHRAQDAAFRSSEGDRFVGRTLGEIESARASVEQGKGGET